MGDLYNNFRVGGASACASFYGAILRASGENGHIVDHVINDPDIAAEYKQMVGGLEIVDYDKDPYEV